MSAQPVTPASGTAVPPPRAPGAYEPGLPVSGAAWDVRSRAALTAAASAQRKEPAGRTGAPGKARRPVRTKGGPADPVRELMHRHREMCERAVDPLEIAAGLEAHGVTDRTAARFRHRDVFSLAEELFARVPRTEGSDATAQEYGAAHRPAYGTGAWIRRAAAAGSLVALPALLTGAALVVFALTDVRRDGAAVTAASVAVAALTVVASVRLALRRVVRAAPSRTAILAACLLSVCAVLTGMPAGAPAGAGPYAAWAVVPMSLACSLVPAAWCARWFALRARRKLTGSRSLDEFTAGMRPLLTATVVLFAAALLATQAAVGRAAGRLAQQGGAHGPFTTEGLSTTALGLLLFTALLLTAHGFRRAASAGLGAACVLEALVLGFGPEALSGPVPAQGIACGCAAAGLLAYAYRALTGASAHASPYGDHTADRAHPADDESRPDGDPGARCGSSADCGCRETDRDRAR